MEGAFNRMYFLLFRNRFDYSMRAYKWEGLHVKATVYGIPSFIRWIYFASAVAGASEGAG